MELYVLNSNYNTQIPYFCVSGCRYRCACTYLKEKHFFFYFHYLWFTAALWKLYWNKNAIIIVEVVCISFCRCLVCIQFELLSYWLDFTFHSTVFIGSNKQTVINCYRNIRVGNTCKIVFKTTFFYFSLFNFFLFQKKKK